MPLPKLEIAKDNNNIIRQVVASFLPYKEIFEDGYVQIYNPTFDLYSYGKTKKEAMRNLTKSLVILLQEINNQGTLLRFLDESGWRIKDNELTPPQVQLHYESALNYISQQDLEKCAV